MRYKLFVVLIFIAISLNNFGDDKKVLFLYDMFDDESEFYINTIRQNLEFNNLKYDEISVESGEVPVCSTYNSVLIYGKVMAFNLMSPLRDWLKTNPSLSGPDIYLLLTANRWFIEDYRKQIIKLTKENGGIIVDSISSATKDLSKEEKRELITRLFNRFQ